METVLILTVPVIAFAIFEAMAAKPNKKASKQAPQWAVKSISGACVHLHRVRDSKGRFC